MPPIDLPGAAPSSGGNKGKAGAPTLLFYVLAPVALALRALRVYCAPEEGMRGRRDVPESPRRRE